MIQKSTFQALKFILVLLIYSNETRLFIRSKIVVWSKKILFLFLISLLLSFKGRIPSENDIIFFVEEYCNDFYPEHNVKEVLFISIKQQRIYLLRHGHLVTSYPVSTSKYGLGGLANSKKTPLGLHKIAKKIGDGVPLRGIIKGGVYIGKKADLEHYPITIEGDFVTTRLLWLSGLEPGKNSGVGKDSYKRRIYIHGTPEEGLIGTPSSHGCIRMTNHEIVELFKLVNEGLNVLILNV